MQQNINLTYFRCFCCSKNYNVSKLIEINTNSVMIGDENLSFNFLLLDVCLLKVIKFYFVTFASRYLNIFIFRSILQNPVSFAKTARIKLFISIYLSETF